MVAQSALGGAEVLLARQRASLVASHKAMADERLVQVIDAYGSHVRHGDDVHVVGLGDNGVQIGLQGRVDAPGLQRVDDRLGARQNLRDVAQVVFHAGLQLIYAVADAEPYEQNQNGPDQKDLHDQDSHDERQLYMFPE